MTKDQSFKSRNTLVALRRLEKIILNTLDFRQVVQKICDSVISELYFIDLSYKIVILSLINQEQKSLQIVAISNTPEAEKAATVFKTPFLNIHTPLSDESTLNKVLSGQSTLVSTQWSQIFSPPFATDQAQSAQAAAGITATVLAPIIIKGKPQGVLMFAVSKPQEMVSPEEKELMQGFTDIVSIAVENSRLYSSLDVASKQLAAANQKLKSLDLLKDEFVSAAAHALRAPMTAIKGYISMTLEGDGGQIPAQAAKFIQSAYEGNDRLIRLVNHMLDISRIESGRLIFTLVPTKLADLISSEVTSLQILAKKQGLTLVYQPPPQPLPVVTVDPDRLREVINNLVGNALKFTRSGSITISHEVDSSVIHTHVTDTGQGIAPEDMKSLFRKFTQAKSSQSKASGSGLGLYVSKIIMKELGGDISVKSDFGKGSTFTFSIPIKKR